eukprot:766092-Hanusia_phi.AAC.5
MQQASVARRQDKRLTSCMLCFCRFSFDRAHLLAPPPGPNIEPTQEKAQANLRLRLLPLLALALGLRSLRALSDLVVRGLPVENQRIFVDNADGFDAQILLLRQLLTRSDLGTLAPDLLMVLTPCLGHFARRISSLDRQLVLADLAMLVNARVSCSSPCLPLLLRCTNSSNS